MTEEWRDIPGFSGYQVSDAGRVRSLDRVVPHPKGDLNLKGRMLKPGMSTTGYHYVNLRLNSKPYSRKIHRLVLLAFIGPRPDGLETRHLNGCATDNRLENLSYGTPSANQFDRVRHGTHHNASKTNCKYQHAFTIENTLVKQFEDGRTQRWCRACIKRRSAEQATRRRLARVA